MKRRQFFMYLAGSAALGWTGWKFHNSRQTGHVIKVSQTGHALGTSVELTVYHRDRILANRALSRAFEEIEQVEKVMSIYRPESQLGQLNTNKSLENPHPWLVEVIEYACRLSEQTGGAFDATVQPLWQLYYQSNQKGIEPDEAEIREVVKSVNWQNIRVSPNLLELKGSGTQVTLNGIAQGFAADAVARVLSMHGVESAFIDTGEIGTVGIHEQKEHWTVGIKHPRNPKSLFGIAQLRNRCLATSGDYETRFDEDYRNHHLIDPKTGHSPGELSSVTVAAPTALQADGLSTAVFLLGIQEGLGLIKSTPGADALFITKNGRSVSSPGFPHFS